MVWLMPVPLTSPASSVSLLPLPSYQQHHTRMDEYESILEDSLDFLHTLLLCWVHNQFQVNATMFMCTTVPAWTTLSATVECDMHTPHTSVHKYKCRYIYRYTHEQTQDEMVKSHLWEGISTSAYAHSLCCVPRNFYIGLYLHRCVRSIGLGYSYRIFSVYCIAKRVVWMAIFSLSLGFVRSFLQLWVLYTYAFM